MTQGGSECERIVKGEKQWGRGEKNWDSQLAEFLAELPGLRSDPADGVVAEVELLQSQQSIQPALTHLCQVVVVQLPAGPHTELDFTYVPMEELN